MPQRCRPVYTVEPLTLLAAGASDTFTVVPSTAQARLAANGDTTTTPPKNLFNFNINGTTTAA